MFEDGSEAVHSKMRESLKSQEELDLPLRPTSGIGYKVVHGEQDNLWNKGFPQGVAYSAFLSVLYLRGLKLLPSLLMYADDGLLYSNEPFDEDKFRSELSLLGLELSESKCK